MFFFFQLGHFSPLFSSFCILVFLGKAWFKIDSSPYFQTLNYISMGLCHCVVLGVRVLKDINVTFTRAKLFCPYLSKGKRYLIEHRGSQRGHTWEVIQRCWELVPTPEPVSLRPWGSAVQAPWEPPAHFSHRPLDRELYQSDGPDRHRLLPQLQPQGHRVLQRGVPRAVHGVRARRGQAPRA